MEFFLQKARSLAEETAKRSQEFAKETAKRSQELAYETAKISQDFARETAKKSRELAQETARTAQETAMTAGSRLKAFSMELNNTPSVKEAGPKPPTVEELAAYGVTEDLREFVKGLTIKTFKDFPLEEVESGSVEVPDGQTVGSTTDVLPPWRERHAMFVLQTVPEISEFRYVLCPRRMKESRFWKIYFLLVQTHISEYEEAAAKRAEEEKARVELEEKERKAADKEEEARKAIEVSASSKASAESAVAPPVPAPTPDGKPATPAKKGDDLDAYLMSALDDDEDGEGDGFDPDDFDQFVSSANSDSDGDVAGGKSGKKVESTS